MFHDLSFLKAGNLKVDGPLGDYLHFVIEDQLKDRTQWAKFVEPFATKEDSDGFWRGEFFGKEMRGASLAYRLTQDEELGRVLKEAAENLLKTQEGDGRISTYSREKEFSGWDLWCRKYVLTGLLHYVDVCKDEAFKKQIIEALKRHLDYILERIGPESEGKKPITTTSSWWGCVNSCTILEPTLALYRITKEPRYLDFARYIISTGGSSDCNFIELALENRLDPFEYPVTKAYETMSFFEGLLAYYELTGEKKYFTAVTNFVEAVASSDLTLIGCSGCTHELFDHSSLRQTEPSDGIMQETCVAVTWMRLSARLYFLTGEKKYLDRIEESALNDLYGSLNTEHQDQHNLLSKIIVPAMTFDSYSPLVDKQRGLGTGGYLEFASGGHCGCCVAIGACGVALYPLMGALSAQEGIVLTHFFDGEIHAQDQNGHPCTLILRSGYPRTTEMSIRLEGESDSGVRLFFHPPFGCTGLQKDGEPLEVKENGYASFVVSHGKEVVLRFERVLKAVHLNSKIAFRYGELTLAGDEGKSPRPLLDPVCVAEPLQYELLEPRKGEFVRLKVKLQDGSDLLLSDYQSCGKLYNAPKNKISVWFQEGK